MKLSGNFLIASMIESLGEAMALVAKGGVDLTTCRKTLLQRVVSCADEDFARVGLHPAFGALTLAEWLDFFLIHEAHRLYVAMTRARS